MSLRVLCLLLAPYITVHADWTSRASYTTSCQAAAGNNQSCARHHPVTFSNGTHGYIGLGNSPTQNVYFNDFYRYDVGTDHWTAIANYPLALGYSYGASSFGVGSGANAKTPTHAYIGFGSTSPTLSYPVDFYRFNFADETFEKLADFIGDGRRHPAMVVTVDANGEDDKVFVGCGSNGNGNLKDWFSYDIADNSWEQLADLPGAARHHPYYFAIDNKAYVGLGHGDRRADGVYVWSDWYVWSQGSWGRVADLPNGGKVAGTQFSYGGKGYVLSGDGPTHGYLPTGELWSYDPKCDEWKQQLPAHPGESRWAPGCFVLQPAGAGTEVALYFTSGYNRKTQSFKDDLFRLALTPSSSPTTSPTTPASATPTTAATTSNTATPTTAATTSNTAVPTTCSPTASAPDTSAPSTAEISGAPCLGCHNFANTITLLLFGFSCI